MLWKDFSNAMEQDDRISLQHNISNGTEESLHVCTESLRTHVVHLDRAVSSADEELNLNPWLVCQCSGR